MTSLGTALFALGVGIPMVGVGLLTGLSPEAWYRRSHGVTGGRVADRNVLAYRLKSGTVTLVGLTLVAFGIAEIVG